MTRPRSSPAHGFLLLEMVLALAIFGMAATGFAVALNQMAKASDLAQRELRLTRILDSALAEAMSSPSLTESDETRTLAEGNIEIRSQISILENLTNQDGQQLQEMYSIKVTASWYDAGEWKNRSVETWRYGRMYQP